MGRIEYEYPLFKVYYSNNSNNSATLTLSSSASLKLSESWESWTSRCCLPSSASLELSESWESWTSQCCLPSSAWLKPVTLTTWSERRIIIIISREQSRPLTILLCVYCLQQQNPDQSGVKQSSSHICLIFLPPSLKTLERWNTLIHMMSYSISQ